MTKIFVLILINILYLNNFKLKLNDDIYNNDDSVLQEGNNSITKHSLKYFESKSSELEDKNIEEKKDKNFFGKKIERNNEEIEEMEKLDKKSKNKKKIIKFLLLKKNLFIVWIILKCFLLAIFCIMLKKI